MQHEALEGQIEIQGPRAPRTNERGENSSESVGLAERSANVQLPQQLVSQFSSWSLKSTLRSHQGLVTSLQYIVRAGIMFIPSSYEFYEMAAEGCYSVSHLIHYVNDIILNDTVQRSSCLEDLMVVTTRGISYIEVLCEKMAFALGGEYRRTQIVFYVELLKSLCRLLMLVDRRKGMMLVHWNIHNDPDQPKLDLSHYKEWYISIATRQMQQAASRTPTAAATFSDNFTELATRMLPSKAVSALAVATKKFHGQRSGLKLSISSHEHYQDVSVPSNDTITPVSVSALPENRVLEIRGADAVDPTNPSCDLQRRLGSRGVDINALSEEQSAAVDPHSPPCHPAIADRKVSPEDETLDKGMQDVRSDIPIAKEVITTNHAQLVESESPPQQPSLPVQVSVEEPSAFGPEMYIVLGEVLYVMRPALYAWALHQVSAAYEDQHAESVDTFISRAASNFSSGSRAGAGDGGAGPEEDPLTYVPTNESHQQQRQQRHRNGLLVGRMLRMARASLWPTGTISTLRHWKRSFTQRPEPTGAQYTAQTMHVIAAAVSLSVEIISIRLSMTGLQMLKRQASRASGSSLDDLSGRSQPHPFDMEIQRRQLALLFYLLRAPLFNRATLPLLQIASGMLERIPLVGSLPVTAINLLKYLNRTHFYTSSSS